MTSNKTNLNEFINRLREKQFELRCEKAMNSIQSYNRKEFLKSINDEYNSFLIDEKRHFIRFFDIISGIKSNPPSIPNPTFNLTKRQNISLYNQVHIKSLAYFVKRLMENNGTKLTKNINNPDFIYTLAFSLFPSISTNFHINLLPKRKGELLNKKNDYINYQLHINFCISFFQPIFSNLQNQETNKEKYKSFSIQNFITSQFKIHFDHYTHLVPPFIALNLKLSDNPIRTLVKNFFEIALETGESAQFYGLFHFSRPPSEKLLTDLKEIFVNDQSTSNNILKLFSDKLISIGETIQKQMEEAGKKMEHGQLNILTCSCPETTVLEEVNDHYKCVTDNEARVPLALKMKNLYFEEDMFINQNKEMFRKVLLSLKDIEVLKYIYEEIDDVNSLKKFQFSGNENSYFWVIFGFNEDGSDDNVNKEDDDDNVLTLRSLDISKTMRNDNYTIVPNLRHILQNSDPIPVFKKVPENMTIEKFFNEYLVNKGPLSTLAKRKADYKVIFSICAKNRIMQVILEALDSTTLEQTEEIEKLTIATNTNKRIDEITNVISSINDNNTEIINNLIYLNKQENKTYIDKLKIGINMDYIQNPNKLLNDFDENYEHLRKLICVDKPQLILMKMIDHEEIKSQFLSFKFTSDIIYKPIFLDFIESNPFAESVDINFSKVLNASIKKIIEIFLNKCFPTKNVSRSTKNKND